MLTEREQELLDLLRKGHTKADCAREMNLTRQRVSEIWGQLLNKGAISVQINEEN